MRCARGRRAARAISQAGGGGCVGRGGDDEPRVYVTGPLLWAVVADRGTCRCGARACLLHPSTTAHTHLPPSLYLEIRIRMTHRSATDNEYDDAWYAAKVVLPNGRKQPVDEQVSSSSSPLPQGRALIRDIHGLRASHEAVRLHVTYTTYSIT